MLSRERYSRHANSTMKARNINTSNVNTYVWGEKKHHIILSCISAPSKHKLHAAII